jgi:hypothetical protein
VKGRRRGWHQFVEQPPILERGRSDVDAERPEDAIHHFSWFGCHALVRLEVGHKEVANETDGETAISKKIRILGRVQDAVAVKSAGKPLPCFPVGERVVPRHRDRPQRRHLSRLALVV